MLKFIDDPAFGDNHSDKRKLVVPAQYPDGTIGDYTVYPDVWTASLAVHESTHGSDYVITHIGTGRQIIGGFESWSEAAHVAIDLEDHVWIDETVADAAHEIASYLRQRVPALMEAADAKQGDAE